VPDGYLSAARLPDSLALLPPPPAAGSAALANDQAVSAAAYALRGTPRWTQAALDADLSFPHAAGTFACAAGVRIDAASTPAAYRLLRRSQIDASRATRAAKDRYRRPRPFMRDDQPTCAPGDEADLRGNGSYPSGHTAIGWAWALILAEAAPERADAILARGRSFGESRLVCHAHWQSDVLEGRFVGAAVVAKLHDDPAFRADLDAAKRELAAARAHGAAPDRDCAAEADALSRPIPGAL
jgi:acid phosphatase (class A)